MKHVYTYIQEQKHLLEVCWKIYTGERMGGYMLGFKTGKVASNSSQKYIHALSISLFTCNHLETLTIQALVSSCF